MVIHGIILAKILEWVGMTSRASSGPRDQTRSPAGPFGKWILDR